MKDASRLTGQLFLQKSAVNLLSTVLDVPEFFWDAADELQGLYGTVTKYLELKNRVAVLNARYEVLESMLLMVQQQLQNERDTSNLRLQYERALWQEKLKTSQLQSAVQYGGAGAASPYGYSPYGYAARPIQSMGFGGFGAAALGGLGLGGMDMFSTPVF